MLAEVVACTTAAAAGAGAGAGVTFAAVDFFLVLYATVLTLAVDVLAVAPVAADEAAFDAAAAAREAFAAASKVLIAIRPPTPKNIPAARPVDTSLCVTDVGRRVRLRSPWVFMCTTMRQADLHRIIRGLGAG